MSRSKYEFFKEASLSQQLAHRMKEYIDYAGADPKTSLTLARLRVLGEAGIINLKDKGISLLWNLLNEKRKALFATSDKVNEITKMGLQMPKAEYVYIGEDEDSEDTDA